MADSKITDFQAAITATPADIVPIVQAGFNKKILLGTIMQNLPGAKLTTGYLTSASKNVVTTVIGIPIDKAVVEVNSDSGNYSLANGEVGQELLIYNANAAGIFIAPTTALGFTTIQLSNPGDNVSLHYTALGWIIRSSYGAIIV